MAGGFVHGRVGKQQAAFLRILAAIFQNNSYLYRTVYRAHLAFGNLAAHFHHIQRRLGNVHIHRIGLLNSGQHGCTAGSEQCAFGYVGAADIARNRRGDASVVHINLCRADGGAGGVHISHGRALCGHGGIVFLFADGIGGHQGLVACQVGIGFGLGGFGRGQLGARAGEAGGIAGVVQLIQRLTGLHITAFLEQAAFDDAAHLWAHFGGTERFQAAGQLGADGGVFCLYGEHADHQFRCGLLLLCAFAAGRQRQYGSHGDCAQPEARFP